MSPSNTELHELAEAERASSADVAALAARLKDVERHLDHHDAVDEIRRRGKIARRQQTADRLYGVGIGVYVLIVIACLFPEQTARLLGRMASWRFDA